MIDTEFKEIGYVNKKYPCILHTIIYDKIVVVLFHGYYAGTVIHSNSNDHPFGYYSDNWDMKEFKNITCEITIIQT